MSARGERWALAALAAIGVITFGWWALALWPLAADTPGWLVRTRAVCFNTTASGLPDPSGWLLLVGQPLGMVGFLVVGWGRTLAAGLGGLWRRAWGRLVLTCALVVTTVAAGGAVWRVAGASAVPAFSTDPSAVLPPRVDRPVPPLDLIDQSGLRITLDNAADAPLSGAANGPILVTFAYAHCETVCPLVIRDALDAKRQNAERRLRVVVVTLDPWRDTPARLPAVARRWGLGPGEHVVSGSVEAVEATLDAWNVPRARDARTGDVVHPRLTYLVDRGRIVYASTGAFATLTALIDRL